MKKTHLAALLVGTVALSLLVAWQGLAPILSAFGQIGARLLWLPLYSVVPLTFAVLAWHTLFHQTRLPFGKAAFPAIAGLSINWLLPAAQIGGELARWQLGVQRGHDQIEAGAAAVVDKTMQLLTQIVFTLIGLALLVGHFSAESTGQAIGLATLFFTLLVATLFWMQRRGFFAQLHRLGGRFKELPSEWKDHASEMDAAIRCLYRDHRGAVFRCAAYRMLFRVLMVGEIWLALHFLGADVGWTEAVVLESAAQAIRVGAFFIPAGVGAQEGGLVALGLLMGISPELCLSAGLCKRVRELGVGLPAIWVWQSIQTRRMLST